MARFIFKFQPLLKLKVQMEDCLKNELGKATQKLEHEKEVLRRIECEMRECINEFNTKSSMGIVVERLREYNAYISFLKEKIVQQKENIKYAQDNVDKYREQLIKVVQEREMLDKLKEKEYTKFLKEQARLEQMTNDEIVSFNYSDRGTEEKDG